MDKPDCGIASRLFESTIYNGPHEPDDKEARDLQARLDRLEKSIHLLGGSEILGEINELMFVIEQYRIHDSRAAFVLGFKAGGQAMRELLGE